MALDADDRMLDNRPVSALVSDALQQFSRLMRNEFALAKGELIEKGQVAARGAAMVVAGGLLALPSLTLVLIALAAFFMEMGMRASLACLLSGIIGLAIAGIVAWTGLNRLKGDALVPRRTISQLQQDAATAKEHL